MKRKMFRIIVPFVVLALMSMACNEVSNPRAEGGPEANAEAGLETIIETQAAINETADAVYDTVDDAAEAVGIPDGSEAGQAIVDASPNLLEQATALAKRIAQFDACMNDCDSEDSSCHRNCEILWAE